MWSVCEIKNSNPDIPERKCFNDSKSMDGRELYKQLCLPPPSDNTNGVDSSSDEMSFDYCVRQSETGK